MRRAIVALLVMHYFHSTACEKLQRCVWICQNYTQNTVDLLCTYQSTDRKNLKFWQSLDEARMCKNVVTCEIKLFEIRLSVVCLSSVCLSSVTFVRPTCGVETFGNISSPLCTLAILWPPCKILRRLFQENPSFGGFKRKMGNKLGYISWSVQDTVSGTINY